MLKKTADIPTARRTFVDVSLVGARFHNVDLSGSTLRGVLMAGAEIDGDIEGLTVNGVEVAPLITAEIDRRHPEHKWLRSASPAVLRRASATIGASWDTTIADALSRPASFWRMSVDDEWSLIETLRHLVFAHDAWFRRAIMRQRDPFWPGGLLTSDMPASFATMCKVNVRARPSVDSVLAEWAVRRAELADFLEGVTKDDLAGRCPRPLTTGHPASPQRFTVGRCISIVLFEQWAHHQFIERDLARVRSRTR